MASRQWTSASQLLSAAALYRFDIEKTLRLLFPEEAQGLADVELFGKMRAVAGTWGRRQSDVDRSRASSSYSKYFPFHKDSARSIECIYTPAVGRYECMEPVLREVANVGSDRWKGQAPFTITKLMYKQLAAVKQIESPEIQGMGRTLPLSCVWYEHSDSLVQELRSIPHSDSRFMHMQYNPNLYRAIYHSPIDVHAACVRHLDGSFPSSHQGEAMLVYVKKLYWLLSQLTLYSRGSAAVTEMVCSVLLSQNKRAGIADRRVLRLCHRDAIAYPYPDMLAMVSHCYEWEALFDHVLKPTPVASGVLATLKGGSFSQALEEWCARDLDIPGRDMRLRAEAARGALLSTGTAFREFMAASLPPVSPASTGYPADILFAFCSEFST